MVGAYGVCICRKGRVHGIIAGKVFDDGGCDVVKIIDVELVGVMSPVGVIWG